METGALAEPERVATSGVGLAFVEAREDAFAAGYTARVPVHAALLEEPQRTVSDSEIAALADPDARENYRIVLAFRDRLTAAGTVEGAYLGCFETPGAVPVPPLFIGQMAHLIARNILAETEYPLRLRAGELLFREQKVTINDGFLMAADAETVAAAVWRVVTERLGTGSA